MYFHETKSSLKTYRLFISHAWKYSDGYIRLVNMLDMAPRFNWYNHSVPEHDRLDTTTNAELTKKLRDQISGTHCVVIISGMYFNHSKWIQSEIDIAQAMGKPIVAVKPWGSQNTPQAVKDAANELIGWNTSSIVSAIRTHSL